VPARPVKLGAALLVATLAACARKDATSLVVRVESDLSVPTEIDEIQVGGAAPVALASPSDLPVLVGFVPSGSSSAEVDLTAVARLHGTDVVSLSFTTSFEPGKVLEVVIHLDRACIGKICGAGLTCERGACGPKSRPGSPYPVSEDAGRASDGPADAPAVDAPAKDAPAVDAPAKDAPASDTPPGGDAPAGDVPADARDAGLDQLSGESDAADAAADRADGGDVRPAGTCGDGVMDPGEQCDVLGGADTATCNGKLAGSVACHRPQCGDGYINAMAGEQCDTPGGGETATCNGASAPSNVACHPSVCGDGYRNVAAGEGCDVGPGGADIATCNGTSAPAALRCQIVRCGDGYVNAAAGETCDDFNTSACGSCNATCSAAQPPTAATGSITAVSANLLANGETFTISDGIHPPVTFEFNSTTAGVGHVLVQRIPSASPATVAASIRTAILSGGAALAITATINASNAAQVLLQDGNTGVPGNVAITETVANTGFVVSGMSGGVGDDCPTATGCSRNDDCASRVCCLGGGCALHVCLAPTCLDAVQNGSETDVDCGGLCPTCASGAHCNIDGDCTSDLCSGPAGHVCN